jgi:hypothetical protein
MANVKKYSKKTSGNVNLTTSFKIKEFACNDGSDTILIDLDMIYILQKIRDLGGAVTINSAYRTTAWNKKQGGASNSYHLYGRAFDIKCANLSLDNICKLANSLGVKGIIKYPTFVHIDSRTSKYHATNSGAGQSFEKYNIPFTTTVKSGTKGTEAGIVQFKLSSLGYSCGNADGCCGTKTVNAIKQFQSKNGLSVDGIVGKNTWNKLFN